MQNEDVLENVGKTETTATENENVAKNEQNENTTSTNETTTVVEKNEENDNQIVQNEEDNTTFTKDELNEIVRNRLKREQKSFLKKCGVETDEELNKFIEGGKGYQALKTDLENEKMKSQNLEKELAFVKNEIDMSKKEDIEKYFKEHNLQLDEKNLSTELEKHNDWKKKTIKINNISPERGKTEATDEKKRVAKLFGLKEIL